MKNLSNFIFSYSSIESRVSPPNNTSSSRLFSRPSDTLVRIPESRPDEYPIKHSVSSRNYDHSGIDSGRANFSQASRRQPLTIANQVSKVKLIFKKKISKLIIKYISFKDL
jgi:hypothetical protein